MAANLLCELISKVLDIEDVAGSLALVLPFFAVCVENTVTKKVVERCMEFRAFDVVFKVACCSDIREKKETEYVSTNSGKKKMSASLVYLSKHARHCEDQW